jgi:hypothetical protein
MPFHSKAQFRLCKALESRGNSSWDCDEWLRETPGGLKNLPEYAKTRSSRRVKSGRVKSGRSRSSRRSRSVKRSRSSRRSRSVKRSQQTRSKSSTSKRKLKTGPRGGKYYVKNGVKVYVKM